MPENKERIEKIWTMGVIFVELLFCKMEYLRRVRLSWVMMNTKNYRESDLTRRWLWACTIFSSC
jgi:hypothetical protein